MRDIMTEKRNKWLARNMRQQDILPNHCTEELYVPYRKTMADMPDEYLRKQLCGKAGGSVCICVGCEGKCTVGKLLLERSKTA